MSTHEYKRFRMEIDLQRFDLAVPELPDGYRWVAWKQLLCERHATVKWKAFRNDVDGRVFPCLSNMDGCRKLISEITRQPHFAPDATWLLTYHPDPHWPVEDCGAIQAVIRSSGIGSIQNVGVVKAHRGLGLGKALVLKALNGFWLAGCHKAVLEVTAINKVAAELYQSLGFEVIEVLYRRGDGGTVIKGTERQPLRTA